MDISYKTNRGRLGSDFSVVEILQAVYSYKNEDDIFVLSKGHAALAHYCTLAQFGYFPIQDVYSYTQFNSNFGGHADRLKVPGIEVSTGSLGHGLGIAVGIALALKLKQSDQKVFVVVGDGEANEGSIWESLHVASKQYLNNLYIIFDENHSQQTRALHLNTIGETCRELGCDVEWVDGHDISDISSAFRPGLFPKVILASTIKGYPCRTLIDNKLEWHSKAPNDEYYQIFKDELNAKTI